MKRPNIVLITSDQHRRNSAGSSPGGTTVLARRNKSVLMADDAEGATALIKMEIRTYRDALGFPERVAVPAHGILSVLVEECLNQ